MISSIALDINALELGVKAIESTRPKIKDLIAKQVKRITKRPRKKMSLELEERFAAEALPHLQAVYGFALSLCRNKNTAEELAQECFLRAYRGFHSYQEGTNCKAWLFRICKNVFIDTRRRKQRASENSVEDIEVPSYDPSWQHRSLQNSQMGFDTAMEDLFGDEIIGSLEDLPENFREALLLCDVDGLSYQEISKHLDIPIGTVRSRISRGRGILRDSLSDYASKQGYGEKAS